MRELITGVCILCLSLSSYAQSSIDLLSVSGRYGLPANYIESKDANATETGILVNFKLPIRFGEKYIWYNQVTYTNFTVSSDTTFSTDVYDPIKLYGFIIQSGLVIKMSESTALQLIFAPRFMTDFENVNGKNWQIGAIGLYEKTFSEKLMMRFGVLYNMELFGPIINPIIHTDWKIGKRWSVVGMWPIYGKVNYHISDNTTTGFSHFGLTTTYRLGGANYQNDYIERNSIDLSLFLRQRIAGNIFIEGRFGHSFSRKYAQYSEDQKLDYRILIFSVGDNRDQKNMNFENGFIGDLRLVYNLALE